MGTTYTCDINIEDPRYASIYGADKVNLSISLVLAKLGIGHRRKDR